MDQSRRNTVGSIHSLFILKCVYIMDPEAKDVCRVIVRNRRDGMMLIPAKVVEKGEQLDEVVIIAMAMVDRGLEEVVPDREGGEAP